MRGQTLQVSLSHSDEIPVLDFVEHAYHTCLYVSVCNTHTYMFFPNLKNGHTTRSFTSFYILFSAIW